MIFSGAQLPTDRESVFWLNVLDVPPSPDNADSGDQNYLQVAFRSRLKLFYRPQGLKGVANDAPALRWTRTGDRLRVENPSPFHVTLAEVHAVTGSSEKTVEDKGAMVAPKQSLVHRTGGLRPGALHHHQRLRRSGGAHGPPRQYRG